MAHRSKRPYNLPEQIKISPDKVNPETGIPMDLLKKLITKHEEACRRYTYLEELYKGFHDIYNDPEKEAWKPDNRLAANFPRYITETFLGYGYGTPIQVKAQDETLQDELDRFGKINELRDHDAEMAKLCCMDGHGWEYFYQNEESETRVKAFSPRVLFCVYDNTIENHALLAIRYGRHGAEDRGHVNEPYGEVMTPLKTIKFDHNKFDEPVDNPYGYIPVVEWKLNEERIGLYEEVAGLIEAYNFTMGEKANDVQAFAEAYLEILGTKVDEDQVRRIRDDRVINFFGTDDAKDILVQFLTKPTADSTQENLLNRLEDHIYELSMVADISDETFGNATSGTALAYKLQAMSNLALTFDRKIEKSLRKRYKIWASLSTNTAKQDAWKDIEFTFSRNLPKNKKEEAELARELSGIVSHKTQLEMMPSLVQNPDDELDRIAKEGSDEVTETITDNDDE